jgi:hypothetical protein
VSRTPTPSPQVVNGTASSGGGDIGIIAAGIAIPFALLAVCAVITAAALLLWRRRNRGEPAEAAVAVGAPSLNAITISPLYAERTHVHTNELYDGDDNNNFGEPDAGVSQDPFAAHAMSWDSV